MRFWRPMLWPVGIAATVFLASGRGQLASPDVGISLDKAAHFLVFGMLATSVIRLPSLRRQARWGGWVAWGLVAGFGGLDEFRQSFTPGRMVELADWIADALGAAVAVGLYTRWPAYRRVLETPVRWRRVP